MEIPRKNPFKMTKICSGKANLAFVVQSSALPEEPLRDEHGIHGKL